jgi:hypothetical protein
MEGSFREFFDIVREFKWPNMILIEDKGFFNIFDVIEFKPNKNPSNKQLRLTLDLINDMYPLYKNIEIESKVDFLRDIFKIEVSKEKLMRLHSHKDIIFKYVITSAKPGAKKNKIKIKRVRKQ